MTVKRDKSIKIALDAREMKGNIKKNKYQMPNLEDLMNTLAETITVDNQEEVLFTSVDLKYAYGQVPLNAELAKHCNFAIIGGKASGIYRFLTGFYGLTVMPPEFQRIMDELLACIQNVFIFIDDILIVTKGSRDEHEKKVREVFSILDKNNLRLKEDKCKIGQTQIEWLGFEISKAGIKPLNEKIQGISEKLRPNNLKELRSYLGAVNQLTKFIPGLAQITHPFRDILKKNEKWVWKEHHDKAFEKVQENLKNIVKLAHFDKKNKLRIVCDASHEGLGAVLMQLNKQNNWELLSCASRYLSNYEAKYSTNELELLAIVWAVEHFRNYIYGEKFQVISDHKALETALKSNHGNKTYSSRLTRWIDRLLPFDMEVIHQPGRTMGLADYLSRYPTAFNEKVWSKCAKELWESWFTVNTVDIIPEQVNKLFSQPITGEHAENATVRARASAETNCLPKPIKTNSCTMERINKSRELNQSLNKAKIRSHSKNIAKIRRNLPKVLKTSPCQSINSSESSKRENQSEMLKTSPCQSIVSSVESEKELAKAEIKTIKVKTYGEIKDDLLLANYSADTSLENLRKAILERKPEKLSRENKVFKNMFK